jgi:hypothetical protein
VENEQLLEVVSLLLVNADYRCVLAVLIYKIQDFQISGSIKIHDKSGEVI